MTDAANGSLRWEALEGETRSGGLDAGNMPSLCPIFIATRLSAMILSLEQGDDGIVMPVYL